MQTASKITIQIKKIGREEAAKTNLLKQSLETAGWRELEAGSIVNSTHINHQADKGKKAPVVRKMPSGLHQAFNPWSKQRRYFNKIEDACEWSRVRDA